MSGSNCGNIFRLPFSNIPKTSVLINKRCRLIIISSKCVSTHAVCECRPTLPSALAYTRTHTLSHSLSLRVFVLISFYIKTHLPQIWGIRNTDFSLSSSYHFKGYTYTKLSLKGSCDCLPDCSVSERLLWLSAWLLCFWNSCDSLPDCSVSETPVTLPGCSVYGCLCLA